MSENTPAAPSALDRFFDFAKREQELYSLWEEAAIFRPEAAPADAPVFNISMPPPNANGELHLGHSYGYTIMDILGRFHRLLGARVLLLPGKDHAGIQTQVVFEKKLKSEGVDTRAVDTKLLYQQCYDFCINSAHYMRGQEKRLGLSADWSRELFTLDPRLSTIVYDTFKKLWDDGLIYRGNRIVNWSVFSQTAISDVEVEYKEQDGSIWYILYPLVEAQPSGVSLSLPSGCTLQIGEVGLVCATTRPETMLGDTALVVNPDDERYRAFVGKKVRVPLTNRIISIVADKRIDAAFGTGVVKVTPAHDYTDYDIGQDHKLEIIQVIGKDGLMTDAAGEGYAGLKIAACREAVITALTTEGLLLDSAPHKNKVPIGERGKDIIEPLISDQWFIAVDKPGKSIKKRALELLRSGDVTVYPERFMTLFEQWLENLRDWNISRQLWWGHRFPVWYKTNGENKETFVGEKPPGEGWEQEKDVFDTWFSSGQWAFSTIAAQGLSDLDHNHGESDFSPTHTMVMGRDILLFWACRMILLTTYRLDRVPWKNIYFTGLIRDEHGQKMSKSKGNGIDPLKVIEKFGTDALRMALVIGAAPGNDINLGEKKIEGYGRFINKLWNAAKLLEMKLANLPAPAASFKPSGVLEACAWILSETSRIEVHVAEKLKNYDISVAADELYSFTWSTYCDWYLECVKILIDKGDPAHRDEVYFTSVESFRTLLRMLHPFMPFVTEEIYQKLPFLQKEKFLANSAWISTPENIREQTLFPKVIEIVTAVRSVKAALGLSQKRTRISLAEKLTAEMGLLVQELTKADFCDVSEISSERALRKPYSNGVIVCEVEGKNNYRLRLEKDIEANRTLIEVTERKLAGSFATHAKSEVVESERQRLLAAQRALKEQEQELVLVLEN